MSVCVKKKDKTCVHSICVQKIVGLDNHTTISMYEIYLSKEKYCLSSNWIKLGVVLPCCSRIKRFLITRSKRVVDHFYLLTPVYSKHPGFFDLYVCWYESHTHACLFLCTSVKCCALNLRIYRDVFSQNTLASTQRLFLVQSPSTILYTHTYIRIQVTYQTKSQSNCAYVVFSNTTPQ